MPTFSTVLTFLLLNFGALAIGGYFTGAAVQADWYQSLNKAPWTPPGWVFGASWTTIMLCFTVYMAYAWDGVADRKKLTLLYSIQWVLNVIWNPIFFLCHETLLALVVISVLTALVSYFLLGYRMVLKNKVMLMLPYFVWLIIATSLNFYAYWYN